MLNRRQLMRRVLGCVLVLSALGPVKGRAATEEQCKEILEQALAAKNPDTRKQAVVALSLASVRTPMFVRLKTMLNDQDVQVRQAVVAGLAEIKTPEALAALRSELTDDVPEVSFAAAKALWGLHDPAGEHALMAVLEGENKTSSGYLSKEKRDALRMMHTPGTLFLYAVRQGVGFAPVPGLGQGINSMEALLMDPGVSGRAAAALLLATDKSPEIVDALKNALLDMNWSVRAAAVHALALRNDPALKQDLEPMLNDTKSAVRLRAAAGYLRLCAIEESKPAPHRPHTSHAAAQPAPASR
jgi:HEAT repeat protein